MKRYRLIIIIAIFAVIASRANCENNSEKSAGNGYDTQKKCAEIARRFFNKQGFPLYEQAEYDYHYNAKMEKCFILITTTSHIRDEKGDPLRKGSKTLIDIAANKVYGSCIENSDQKPYYMIDGKVCSSEEWSRRIKQYMEE